MVPPCRRYTNEKRCYAEFDVSSPVSPQWWSYPTSMALASYWIEAPVNCAKDQLVAVFMPNQISHRRWAKPPIADLRKGTGP